MFLANYTDCLTDLDLCRVSSSDFRREQGRVAMVTVAPNVSFHYVATSNGLVTASTDVAQRALRVNGGFFVFRREFFDYLQRRRGAGGRAVPAADRRASS